MVQLRILSGSKAGGFKAVRHFPFHVGRAADNDFCLELPGVWDYHLMLDLRPKEGFVVQTFDQALAAINEQPQTSARLRNGDIISFGSAKLQFWLASPEQRSLRLREMVVWALWLFLILGQCALIYFLLG
jgi:hypothetical protein